MWSLSDINRLNGNATTNARKLRREAARKRKPQCGIYGCSHRAEHSTVWYDIFSDDPKGVIQTCPDHGWADDPDLFRCENCERVMVDHYTWERYQVQLHGDSLCLRCAAQRHFDLSENWIHPSTVSRVVLEPGDGPLFNRETCVLIVSRCRQVLAVKQPLPAGVVFHDNAEFDSSAGHQISGENLLDVIRRLDQPFCPVLDAAYQFAVSIGLYVRASAKSAEAEQAAARRG
jgi:hypothetical protein